MYGTLLSETGQIIDNINLSSVHAETQVYSMHRRSDVESNDSDSVYICQE